VAAVKPLLFRVKFEKVAAHTGVKWNEIVDKLAKDAVEKAKKGTEGTNA
jgi:ribonuclease HI